MDEKNKMVIYNIIIIWEFLDEMILFNLENYTFYLKTCILFNINKLVK